MDGGTIPPRDDAPLAPLAPLAAADVAEIRLPDDPRVPQPDDADPTVSKELGGAAPAVGPGRSRREPRTPRTDGPEQDADG
jgi:hypothetical protein